MSKSILKECQLSKVEQKGILIIAFKNFANTWIVTDFMAVSKVYKASLWPEELFYYSLFTPIAKVMASITGEGWRKLFIVQAPQDCEVLRQDWSQWFCPVRFQYMGMQSPLSGLKNRFCLTSSIVKRGSFT